MVLGSATARSADLLTKLAIWSPYCLNSWSAYLTRHLIAVRLRSSSASADLTRHPVDELPDQISLFTWLTIWPPYCLISWSAHLSCHLVTLLHVQLTSWSAHLTRHLVTLSPDQLICSPDSPCLISWSAHLTGHLVEELPEPGLQDNPVHLVTVQLDQLICSPDSPCLISWSSHLTGHLVEELPEPGLQDNPATWSPYCLISWSAHLTRPAWSAHLSPDSPCLISWSGHLTGHLVEELPEPGLQGGVLFSQVLVLSLHGQIVQLSLCSFPYVIL